MIRHREHCLNRDCFPYAFNPDDGCECDCWNCRYAGTASAYRRPPTIREQVSEFHHAFEQPIVDKPHVPDVERVKLRLRLITEEYFETLAAAGLIVADAEAIVRRAIDDRTRRENVDIVEFIDGLADLAYVVEGSHLEFGVDSDEILDEVQRSNMSKLGANGKPVKRPDGKVVKGPNFSPPDIAGVLRRQGWDG